MHRAVNFFMRPGPVGIAALCELAKYSFIIVAFS